MFFRRAVTSVRTVNRCRTYAEKIVMPALSPTMEAGTIANWKKKVTSLPPFCFHVPNSLNADPQPLM